MKATFYEDKGTGKSIGFSFVQGAEWLTAFINETPPHWLLGEGKGKISLEGHKDLVNYMLLQLISILDINTSGFKPKQGFEGYAKDLSEIINANKSGYDCRVKIGLAKGEKKILIPALYDVSWVGRPEDSNLYYTKSEKAYYGSVDGLVKETKASIPGFQEFSKFASFKKFQGFKGFKELKEPLVIIKKDKYPEIKIITPEENKQIEESFVNNDQMDREAHGEDYKAFKAGGMDEVPF